MLEDIEKDIYINDELRYYDLSNIFFDAPINNIDIENIKEIFFSINNISQIYFRKNINIKSIELIKYLLEISPTMEDKNVEKYIIDVDDIDEKELLNMNFINPSTWYISCKDKNATYKILSIDKFKSEKQLLKNIYDKLNLSDYSDIEKMLLLYDFCKKFKVVDEESEDINYILTKKKINQYKFSYLYQVLLDYIEIPNYVGTSITDSTNNEVLIAYLKDSKYKIEGIYLFDLSSDFISKEELDYDNIRTINYNYFAMPLGEYSKTVFNDRLTGVLKCLIHDKKYDLEKIKYEKKFEISQIEKIFKLEFNSIHDVVENTKKIDDNTKLDIITKLVDVKYNDIIRENYKKRNDRIFNLSLLENEIDN